MERQPASPFGGSSSFRRDAVFLALACCAVYTAARLSLSLPRDDGRLAPIWLANAVALTVLLRSPTSRWPALIFGCIVSNALASRSGATHWGVALCLAVSNAVEYTLAAGFLRRLLGDRIWLDRTRHLVLLASASAGGALAASIFAATSLWMLEGANFLASLRTWGMAHPLSLLLLTPCLLVLSRPGEHLRETPFTRGAALSMAALLVCALGVFLQNKAPLLFLVSPVLLVVAIQFGAFGAALGVLLTAVVAVAATLTHHGPVALTHGDATTRAAVLQAFLGICVFSSLPVASLQLPLAELQARTLAEAERAAQAEAEARRSEARYRLLADQASDAIVTLDLQGRFTFASPAAWALTGYGEHDLVGRLAQDFVHSEDYPGVRRAYGALLLGMRASGARLECRFRRRDGEWIWLELNPQVSVGPDRRATGFVDVARDISERRAMEADLRRARVEAEASARAKGEFLANMSHELRTPLTSIVGFAEIAAGQAEMPDLVRSCIDRVQNAGQALLCTVNDILDFSKLEAGQVEIKPAPCDAAELCRTTLELFTPQAAAKDVALRLETAADSLPLLADKARIRQILLNLVGNAIKFTEVGEVSLHLRHQDDELWVEVVDTGPGIAPDKLHLLFKRFSQVDGSLARAHSGTGLGLAICKGLVEAMGGRIGAESEPGRGSRFWFHIPAAALAEVPSLQGEADAPPVELEGLRVLVADDHETNRELVKLFLSGFGGEVSEAVDGAEAVELASTWPYDVILMDLRMPNLDGAAALRLIRVGGGPNDAIPILAYTADATPEDEARLCALGFAAVVSKPVEPARLISTLNAVINAAYEGPLEMADAV